MDLVDGREQPGIAVYRDSSGSESAGGPISNLIGDSPAFSEFLRQLRRLARSSATILVEGETGVGKELAARAIHYVGARSREPFVPVNCGAIPDNLIESELFGHARGAFTDARQAHVGLVAQARGGTLFLDEIETLSAKAQATLLRFLQDQRYRPLGHSREEISTARIIAATNLSLPELVRSGQFRCDLMYRLDILSLRVPPLRERPQDIAPLARHFLRRFCAQYALPAKRLTPAAVRWMERHPWPGNVRELENFLHRQVLLADGEEIACQPAEGTVNGDDASSAARRNDFRSAKAQAIRDFERAYLMNTLEQTGGNITAAARLACKERRSLARLVKKHGIDCGRYRR